MFNLVTHLLLALVLLVMLYLFLKKGLYCAHAPLMFNILGILTNLCVTIGDPRIFYLDGESYTDDYYPPCTIIVICVIFMTNKVTFSYYKFTALTCIVSSFSVLLFLIISADIPESSAAQEVMYLVVISLIILMTAQ